MGQANTVDDQPSMDEILASIRRIIDQGTPPVAPPAPANDPVQADDEQPGRGGEEFFQQRPAARPSLSQADLERFPQALDARVETPADPPLTGPAAVNPLAMGPAETLLPDGEPAADDRGAKYEARFSEEDDRAFKTVADVLALTASEVATPLSDAADAEPVAAAAPVGLISEQTRNQIGASFDALSDSLRMLNGRDLESMTEDILRSMLSEWLDNNLPAIVEKLVRAEIEAIARGTPRQV